MCCLEVACVAVLYLCSFSIIVWCYLVYMLVISVHDVGVIWSASVSFLVHVCAWLWFYLGHSLCVAMCVISVCSCNYLGFLFALSLFYHGLLCVYS